MRTLINKGIVMFAILGTVCGVAAWHLRVGAGQTASFRTAKVTRGDLLVSISATGTVEPEEVIDVGAQVLGRILSFGKDAGGTTVDYGSVVEEGTVLAHIDDSLYLAEVAHAEAQVQSAKAGLEHAEAELEQMKAKLYQADCDWQRAQKLGPSEALAQASYDAYKSAYEIANANVAVGEAAILQARAAIAQAEASLRRAQLNLGYCTIKSPVKGVIIDRRVNIGQTVVASLNAPSLILLAKDLTRMQVWVAVNEADIGKIHPGQPVTFTVDAFPDETFEGKVRKVRLNASMTQSVVTYTVEITTDNSDGRLLPYLTANIQFELDRRSDVFLVPNAALRWNPSRGQITPEFREAFDNRSQSPSGTAGDVANRGVVWAVQSQYVRPVPVRVGLTDDVMTEVEGERLTEGLVVVTGEQAVAKRRPQPGDSTETTNPFAPKLPPGPGGGRGGPPR
jgi:HlyD family secretion protein